MNKKITQFAERRDYLVSKIAMQRAELSCAFSPLRVPLGYADKTLNAIRFVTRHYVLMTGIASLGIFTAPRRWLVILETGWLAWRALLAAKHRLTD